MLILLMPAPGAHRPGRIRAVRAGLGVGTSKTCAKASMREGGDGGNKSGWYEARTTAMRHIRERRSCDQKDSNQRIRNEMPTVMNELNVSHESGCIEYAHEFP